MSTNPSEDDEVKDVPHRPTIHPVLNKKFQDGGRPAGYLAFLPGLFTLCEEAGYTLAVHGSLCRDFDLIAVAWAHGALPADELIHRVAKHCGGKIQDDTDCDAYDFSKRGAEPKPHGRYAWTIHLMSGPKLDLSVMGPEPDCISNSFRRLDESVARFKAEWSLPSVGDQKVRDLINAVVAERQYPASSMAWARIGYEVARRILVEQGMAARQSHWTEPVSTDFQTQVQVAAILAGAVDDAKSAAESITSITDHRCHGSKYLHSWMAGKTIEDQIRYYEALNNNPSAPYPEFEHCSSCGAIQVTPQNPVLSMDRRLRVTDHVTTAIRLNQEDQE